MKETKHTPEPWGVDFNNTYKGEPHYMVGVPGERICVALTGIVGTGDDEESKANARRIVACVNACRSVSDEDLADDCVEKMRADRNQLLEKSKRFCLQCGAPLMLHAVPLNPNNAGSQWTSACSSCGSKAFDVPGNKIKELTTQRDELLAALKEVYKYYVSTLESGRDRIVMLGGDCDPVDMMEERDPVLIKVRALVKKYDHA